MTAREPAPAQGDETQIPGCIMCGTRGKGAPTCAACTARLDAAWPTDSQALIRRLADHLETATEILEGHGEAEQDIDDERSLIREARTHADMMPAALAEPAPAPQGEAQGEALTLERYTRTAVQVALIRVGDVLDEEMVTDGEVSKVGEDAAVKSAQALLTPRARLELAAELLRGLTPMASLSLGDDAAGLELLREMGAQVRTEMKTIPCGIEAKPETREYTAYSIRGVSIYAQHTRPATLDDARRLLEGGK